MFRPHNHSDPHSSSNPNSSTTYLLCHSTAAAAAASAAAITMSDDDIPPSPSPSPSPPPNNKLLALPPPPAYTPSPVSVRTPVFPSREDCWSEEATHTLIEAWGSHYMNLNRGNLRQQHWEQVADAVNRLHGHIKKQYRTDIQCKNRIDTLKKKYKVEKARVSESHGRYISTWPFFRSLNALIGSDVKPSPENITPPLFPPPFVCVPVGLRSKRPMEYAVSPRSFATMAAPVEEDKDEDEEMLSVVGGGSKRKGGGGGMLEGYKRLAEAIGSFSEIYERVERDKQRQMVELEKHRMQFMKDLEVHRLKVYMESQVQLQRLKRVKHNTQAVQNAESMQVQSSVYIQDEGAFQDESVQDAVGVKYEGVEDVGVKDGLKV